MALSVEKRLHRLLNLLEAGWRADKLPWNFVFVAQMPSECTNTECLSRIMTCIDDDQIILFGGDGSPVRTFTDNKSVDTSVDCFFEGIGGRACAAAHSPAFRASSIFDRRRSDNMAVLSRER